MHSWKNVILTLTSFQNSLDYVYPISMLKAEFFPYTLHFSFTAITSRAQMHTKDTYFIKVYDTDSPNKIGVGEVALFKGLSIDDTPDFEPLLQQCCKEINEIDISEINSSAIRFGFETAFSDLNSGGFLRPFTKTDEWAIPINGLVWMGDKSFMLSRVSQKLDEGYRCLKLKIGGINFEDEIDILKTIRTKFSDDVLEIRLDANGGFSPDNAMQRINQLSRFNIHSLEQPVKPGQISAMADICKKSPIPIALDEELIGITPDIQKAHILSEVKPHYIILKPSLCGGFAEADKWITCAEHHNIGWWATSALESNIGLNAIARWLLSKSFTMPQGLGTGQLYTNNIPSNLYIKDCHLANDPLKTWNLSQIF